MANEAPGRYQQHGLGVYSVDTRTGDSCGGWLLSAGHVTLMSDMVRQTGQEGLGGGKTGRCPMGTRDLWVGWLFLCRRGCPMLCRMVNSILGLYPLDIRSAPPPFVINKNVSICDQMLLLGQNHTPELKAAMLIKGGFVK